MRRNRTRIAKIRDYISQELKNRGLKPWTFAQNSNPYLDKGQLHRFLKQAPKEHTSFNFIADVLQNLGLPFATLDTLDLNNGQKDEPKPV